MQVGGFNCIIVKHLTLWKLHFPTFLVDDFSWWVPQDIENSQGSQVVAEQYNRSMSTVTSAIKLNRFDPCLDSSVSKQMVHSSLELPATGDQLKARNSAILGGNSALKSSPAFRGSEPLTTGCHLRRQKLPKEKVSDPSNKRAVDYKT